MTTRAQVLATSQTNTTNLIRSAASAPGARLASMYLELKDFRGAAPMACAYTRELAACLNTIGQVRFDDWETLKLLAGAKAPRLEAAE